MTDNRDKESMPTPALAATPETPVIEPGGGETPAPASRAAAPAGSGRGLATLALALSLLALAGGGYLWYLWDMEKKARLAEAAALDSRVKRTLDEVVQQRDADLNALRGQLTAQRNEAETLLGRAETLKTQNEQQDKVEQGLRDGINNLQAAIRDLQGNIATMKGEVEIHKGGAEIQKADTQNLLSHARNLQKDVQNLKDAQQELQNQLQTARGDVQTHRAALQALQQETQTLTNNLQALQGQLESGVQERNRALGDLDSRIQNIQLAQRNLLTTLDNVRAVASRGGDVNALPLSEVEYLLRIADHKLKLQRDIQGAVEALTAADQRLGTVDESAFRGVQQMIKENIAALRGVQLPDRSALAHKITEMEQRLQDLPLRTDAQIAALKERVKPKTGEGEVEGELSWWRQASTVALAQLKDIVIVRNERSSGPPLMTIKEEYFLVQNLRMELEAMRIALLGDDPTIYLQSDANAQKWLKTYFDTQDQRVAEFITELEGLKNIQFNPYIPDLATTLRAFGDVMARRQPVRSTAVPEAAGSTGGKQP